MGIGKILSKIKDFGTPVEDNRPDDETRDKALRALRRQRRVQLEETEKEMLKKRIATFNKERTKRFLFGVKDRPVKKSPFPVKTKKAKKLKPSWIGKI